MKVRTIQKEVVAGVVLLLIMLVIGFRMLMPFYFYAGFTHDVMVHYETKFVSSMHNYQFWLWEEGDVLGAMKLERAPYSMWVKKEETEAPTTVGTVSWIQFADFAGVNEEPHSIVMGMIKDAKAEWFQLELPDAPEPIEPLEVKRQGDQLFFVIDVGEYQNVQLSPDQFVWPVPAR